MAAHITHLPEELLRMILADLDYDPQALAALAQCCRSLNHRVTPLLYRRLVLTRRNASRLFLGLERRAPPKTRNTSKAEWKTRLAAFEAKHGAAMEEYEYDPWPHDEDRDWLDNTDPPVEWDDSDPETDDELSPPHKAVAADSNSASWKRRLELLSLCQHLTIVQVPSAPLVMDLVVACGVAKDIWPADSQKADHKGGRKMVWEPPTNNGNEEEKAGKEHQDLDLVQDQNGSDNVHAGESIVVDTYTLAFSDVSNDRTLLDNRPGSDLTCLFPQLHHLSLSTRVIRYLSEWSTFPIIEIRKSPSYWHVPPHPFLHLLRRSFGSPSHLCIATGTQKFNLGGISRLDVTTIDLPHELVFRMFRTSSEIEYDDLWPILRSTVDAMDTLEADYHESDVINVLARMTSSTATIHGIGLDNVLADPDFPRIRYRCFYGDTLANPGDPDTRVDSIVNYLRHTAPSSPELVTCGTFEHIDAGGNFGGGGYDGYGRRRPPLQGKDIRTRSRKVKKGCKKELAEHPFTSYGVNWPFRSRREACDEDEEAEAHLAAANKILQKARKALVKAKAKCLLARSEENGLGKHPLFLDHLGALLTSNANRHDRKIAKRSRTAAKVWRTYLARRRNEWRDLKHNRDKLKEVYRRAKDRRGRAQWEALDLQTDNLERRLATIYPDPRDRVTFTDREDAAPCTVCKSKHARKVQTLKEEVDAAWGFGI